MLVSIRVNECYSFRIPLSVLAGKRTVQPVLLDLLTADEVFELEGYVGGMVLAFEQWLPGFEVETKFNGYSVAYRTDPGTDERCLMVDRRGRWVNVYQADYAEKAALVQGMHSLVSELRSAVTAARSSLGVIRSWRDKP